MSWDRSRIGPRVTVPKSPYEDLRDPANGEKVLRCRTCGMPGGTLYGLVFLGKPAGSYRLCDRCWVAAGNMPDPQDADPLQAA